MKKSRKLRIAIMASTHYTSPPPPGVIFAPIHLAVQIGEGLAARGHNVTFYAPKGSKVKGATVINKNLPPLKQTPNLKLFKLNDTPLKISKSSILWDQFMMSELFKDALQGKYDAINIHTYDLAMGFARIVENIPVAYSLHDPPSEIRAEIYTWYKSANQHFISASQAQKKITPYYNHFATVYHGVDTKKFSFSPTHKGYLLYVGRLVEKKGAHLAVQAALKTGHKLILCGAPNTGEFWEKEIKPHLGQQIQYKGSLSADQLVPYYQGAKAVLFPTQVLETFGLVMIESMSCGTPVIGFRNGAVPEVIKDGKTGYIVKNLKEMISKIGRINTIRREDCRDRVVENFSIERMIEGYERVFYKLAQ
jgi:glycosyltransferase involved in cell wall biosynthesis